MGRPKKSPDPDPKQPLIKGALDPAKGNDNPLNPTAVDFINKFMEASETPEGLKATQEAAKNNPSFQERLVTVIGRPRSDSMKRKGSEKENDELPATKIQKENESSNDDNGSDAAQANIEPTNGSGQKTGTNVNPQASGNPWNNGNPVTGFKGNKEREEALAKKRGFMDFISELLKGREEDQQTKDKIQNAFSKFDEYLTYCENNCLCSNNTENNEKVKKQVNSTVNQKLESMGLKQEKGNLTNLSKNIATVKRTQEMEKCGRSVRIFGVETNDPDKPLGTKVKEHFKDNTEAHAMLGNCTFRPLGNRKGGEKTIPVLLEFTNVENRNKFFKQTVDAKKNNELPESTKISNCWPPDIARAFPEWQKNLKKTEGNSETNFMFAASRDGTSIRVRSKKDNESGWSNHLLFSVPPCNFSKFDIPVELGGKKKREKNLSKENNKGDGKEEVEVIVED